MKAFKGCTNQTCKAYGKIRFKKDDEFCTKCGSPLSFVCADCLKVMENGNERYCLSCNAKREQKRAQAAEKLKSGAKNVAAAGAVAVGALGMFAKNADSLMKSINKIKNVAADAAKLVKK